MAASNNAFIENMYNCADRNPKGTSSLATSDEPHPAACRVVSDRNWSHSPTKVSKDLKSSAARVNIVIPGSYRLLPRALPEEESRPSLGAVAVLNKAGSSGMWLSGLMVVILY